VIYELNGEKMRTKHASLRAQQRGISRDTEQLLHTYGEKKPARGGCILKFFSKKSIQRMEKDFGHFFIAKNHEKFKTYLIESRDDHGVVTLGKLYKNQRVNESKVNSYYH
jgi:hypothetical protein